jgi:uncharacterized protein (TIRG00374 family)
MTDCGAGDDKRDRIVQRVSLLKKTYVSFGLAAGLLFLFFRKAEWSVLLNQLKSTSWPFLEAAVAIRMVSLLMASLRWRVLLLPVKKVSVVRLFSAMMIGISADMLIAMQAAEFIRPCLISRWEDIQLSSVLATVVVEWFMDLLAIFILLVPSLTALKTSGGYHSSLQIVNLHKLLPGVLFAALFGLGLLWVLNLHAAAIESSLSRGHSRLPKRLTYRLAGWVKSFSQGLEVIRRPKRLAKVSFYSLLFSFLVGLSSWLVLQSFGLPIPFFAAFIFLGLIAVAGMIPTPGAVGSFHTVCQFGLVVIFNIDPAKTILPVMGLHAALYVPAAIIGVFCLIGQGVATRQINEELPSSQF